MLGWLFKNLIHHFSSLYFFDRKHKYGKQQCKTRGDKMKYEKDDARKASSEFSGTHQRGRISHSVLTTI